MDGDPVNGRSLTTPAKGRGSSEFRELPSHIGEPRFTTSYRDRTTPSPGSYRGGPGGDATVPGA
ncbi:hypothetical protein GCM10009540_95410 [Streptomyces turgidiscabies]